jgi:hypothetical protein
MTQLEARKFADVSTTHVEHTDIPLLDQLADQYDCGFAQAPLGAPILYKYEEGYFIYCGSDVFDELVRPYAAAGLSTAFLDLLKLANAQDMAYLNLDSAGEIYTDLPTFDW